MKNAQFLLSSFFILSLGEFILFARAEKGGEERC
jgi:hypothetical protein